MILKNLVQRFLQFNGGIRGQRAVLRNLMFTQNNGFYNQGVSRFAFSSGIFQEELKALVNEQISHQEWNSFEQINNIMKFVAQKNQGFSDEDVRNHVDYFAKLLDQTKADLNSLLSIESTDKDNKENIFNLMNVLKFSYAMNYDDQELWQNLISLLLDQMDRHSLKIQDIVQVVSVIQNFTKHQIKFIGQDKIEELKKKAKRQILETVEGGDLDSLVNSEIISMFNMSLKYLDTSQYEKVFVKFDDILAQRINELKIEEYADVMNQIVQYNSQAEFGKEVRMDLLLLDGEDFVHENIPLFNKGQLLDVIGAYATSGQLRQYQELLEHFEDEIKQRLSSLSSFDIAYLLKMMSQAEAGSAEFYALIDKQIGHNLNDIEAQYLFVILKSFFDSGHARKKLFIKLQQTVLKNAKWLDVNELCAIMRLYTEMDVQQITFYEEIASIVEKKLDTIDETGLVNALIAFKTANTVKQLPVVSDLEKILAGNLKAFKLTSLCQILFAQSQFKEDRKNQKLLEALVERTIDRLEFTKKNGQNLQPFDVVFLLYSLPKFDVDIKYTRMVAQDLPDVVEQFRDHDLHTLYTIVGGLQQTHDGFDIAFRCIEGELKLRKDVKPNDEAGY